MRETGIEWCDATANFWWGCQKVSPGCEHCYAETLAKRTGNDVWGRKPREIKKQVWNQVEKWDRDWNFQAEGRKMRLFVQSMSDFLEDRPELVEPRQRAMEILQGLGNTNVLLLTKRPENAGRMLAQWYRRWPAHVWFGVSCEDQERAKERLPYLIDIPAHVQFLSVEPLLGPVNLEFRELGPGSLEWVIVGGESGPGHRPMDPDWARSIRDECKEAGVSFFMKQLAGKATIPEDLRVREFPND